MASILAELKTRTLTAFVLIPAFLLVLYEGRYLFALTIIAFLTVAMHEYLGLLQKFSSELPKYLGYVVLYLILFFFLFRRDYIGLSFIIALSITLAFVPLNYAKGYSLKETALLFFGGLYLGVGGGTVYLIRKGGFLVAIAFFLTIWVFDTGAYIGGRLFGKRKLLPKVSPGKSLEGVIAGLVVAIPLVFLYRWLHIYPFVRVPDGIFYIVLIAIFSQLGDLAESVIKREAGVKDSSSIFPGHGGALDRIDSILLAAPMFYAALRLI